MQDDNTAQDAIRSNIEASDLWSFFQAKTMREFMIERDSEMLKVERDGASPQKQAAIDDLLKSWAEKSAKYDSDPESGEGRKELLARAKAAEADRDEALAANNHFGYASPRPRSSSASLGLLTLRAGSALSQSSSLPWGFSLPPCCRFRIRSHIRL